MKSLITADTHECYWLKVYPLLSVINPILSLSRKTLNLTFDTEEADDGLIKADTSKRFWS
jgi:hypothetical protein